MTTLAGGGGSDISGYNDGFGTNVGFNYPAKCTLVGDKLFVTDRNNNLIRSVATKTGTHFI